MKVNIESIYKHMNNMWDECEGRDGPVHRFGFQVHDGPGHPNKPKSGEAGMHQALPSSLIDKFITETAMATDSIVNELIKLTIEICGPFHAMPQLVQYFVEGRNQDSTHLNVFPSRVNPMTH